MMGSEQNPLKLERIHKWIPIESENYMDKLKKEMQKKKKKTKELEYRIKPRISVSLVPTIWRKQFEVCREDGRDKIL